MQNKMKLEFKKAINAILSKDDKTAKAIIRDAIQSDARYISYKKSLQDYGFIFETVTIDEKVFTDIQEVLKEYPVPVQLKILDETYKQIAEKQNGK